MNAQQLLNKILPILHSVKDKEDKLRQILDFLNEEIYEEQEEEILQIPEEFEKLLKPIAGSIDAGMNCYLNPKSLEIEEVPALLVNDPHEYKMLTGFGTEDEELKHQNWDKCYVFEPLKSNESFRIMEAFAENMEDRKFREQLFYALNNRKPFANFKWKIDNSPYRQDWFDFKQKWLEGYVREELYWFLERQEEK